ncbi:DNA methyltransferase [Arthrobacter sp. AB6]|uniref:site-specific DNA-methyltransferase n=1 Tax=Arthrobacter sp. AB6 TaxID=2962570 RepID=UPI0028819783|nr:DNA methyltransferase [Arthrobacter sp. AB6]MDT0196787.1 DNA methyltransferase [Arthrobacter sp. AB6]
MAHIDALIDKVSDPELKRLLREQVDGLLQRRDFGLVFQEHKPEVVELPNYRIRPGCTVRPIVATDTSEWRVTAVRGEVASLESGENSSTALVKDLVVIREFGEAIYPGLQSRGLVSKSSDKPFHSVINSENFHALETLLYAYEKKVDAIYIDPPYNTGARDWKYNNDYVDGIDDYRHSKWLAFMQRRLELAERLLNPADSVLVITIDENEVHHLGVLLEQLFPETTRQMVTIAINGKGVSKNGQLSSVEEYAFFVYFGSAKPSPVADNLFNDEQETTSTGEADHWASLLRRGTDASRYDRPGMFYPFFVDPALKRVVEIGRPLEASESRTDVEAPAGLVAVWPLRTDGSEGRWQTGKIGSQDLLDQGYLKLGAYNRRRDQWAIKYLFKGQRERIESGALEITGRDENGAVLLSERQQRVVSGKTMWNRSRHNAGSYGSGLLRALIPGRSFPFPKSLYAVVDTLRLMVGSKPNALILDFFGGSGTTAHATAYLNAEDGGRRRSIVVTNNEVSPDEARQLREAGHVPGDPEWEALGIFEHVTRPRLEAAFTGLTHTGDPAPGSYLNGTALAAGFDENIEFFDLTYEDPDLISMGRKFEMVAPLLWLRAGACGQRIDTPSEAWAISENGTYGILFDEEKWRDFVLEVSSRSTLTHVFVVTDSKSVYQQVHTELPDHVEATQLYEDYLRTFRINTEVRA